MVLAVNVQSSALDLPTLSLVAVCIAGLLVVFSSSTGYWLGGAPPICVGNGAGEHADTIDRTASRRARCVDLSRLRNDLERRATVSGQARTDGGNLHPSG